MSVIDEIKAERERQISAEGWTLDHDNTHVNKALAMAAGVYVMSYAYSLPYEPTYWMHWWPWDRKWFKPTNPRRDLIKAAALIVAEIERLDRLDEHFTKDGMAPSQPVLVAENSFKARLISAITQYGDRREENRDEDDWVAIGKILSEVSELPDHGAIANAVSRQIMRENAPVIKINPEWPLELAAALLRAANDAEVE